MTGSGTEIDPYIITTATDLQNIKNDLDAWYELGGDIDASATSGWNSGQGFEPISNFSGHLEGNAYTIRHLYINRTQSYVGLFDTLLTGATVQNFYIRHAEIHGTYDVGGGSTAPGAGVLVGMLWYQHPTITRVGVHGTVSLDFTATNHILCGAGGLGGYLRHTDAQITECFADVDVSVVGHNGAWAIGGGFAGYYEGGVSGDIIDAYARGNVAVIADYVGRSGGFIGVYGDGGVEYAYSTGAPSGGTTGGFTAQGNSAEIVACFWDTQTSGTGSSSSGIGKTTAQMKTEATFTDAGWDFSTIWSIDDALNAGYPILQMLPAQIGAEGYLWVEDTKLAYTDANEAKRTQEGTDTGDNGTEEDAWIDGIYQYYVDANGDVRRIEGTLTGLTGKVASQLSINTKSPMLGTHYCYIDSSGAERCFEGS